jgi:hypothetical protein
VFYYFNKRPSHSEPSCPDLHPILYWNLLYMFHRIAAPSHLPGLLLDTPSLALATPPHPSWRGANHTTVKVSAAKIEYR